MFTGLIQEFAGVASVEAWADGARLRIVTSLAPEIASGDSVAVNGACLTATEADEEGFVTEAMNQTLAVTALDGLAEGDGVNLELAMMASDRLGGHIVQGHVDGTGEIVSVVADGFARRLRVTVGPPLIRYVVEKGSIALSGVSLTVAGLGEDWIEVSLIPETLERTNLGRLAAGDRLNIECDLVAKYVERLAAPFAGKDRP